MASGATITQGEFTTNTYMAKAHTYPSAYVPYSANKTKNFLTSDGIENYDVRYDVRQVITKKDLTIYITGATKVYDDDSLFTNYNDPTVSTSGEVPGEVLVAGRVKTNDDTVGHYNKNTSTIITPFEIRDNNGTVNPVSFNYNVTYIFDESITPSPNMDVNCNNLQKPYDGTRLTAKPYLTPGCMYGTDTVTYWYSDSVYTGTTWSAPTTDTSYVLNVRDSILHVMVYGVNHNYFNDTAYCTLKINRIPLTITIKDTKYYNGDTLMVNYNYHYGDSVKISGQVPGENLVAGQVATLSPELGTYTVQNTDWEITKPFNITGTEAGSNNTGDSSNYIISYDVRLNIIKSPYMKVTCPSGSDITHVYDNTLFKAPAATMTYPSVSANHSADTAHIQYSVDKVHWTDSIPGRIKFGETRVYVRAQCEPNYYDDTCSYVLSVTRRPIVLYLDTAKTYDSTVIVSDITAQTVLDTTSRPFYITTTEPGSALAAGQYFTAGTITTTSHKAAIYNYPHERSLDMDNSDIDPDFETSDGIDNYDLTVKAVQTINRRPLYITIDSTKIYDLDSISVMYNDGHLSIANQAGTAHLIAGRVSTTNYTVQTYDSAKTVVNIPFEMSDGIENYDQYHNFHMLIDSFPDMKITCDTLWQRYNGEYLYAQTNAANIVTNMLGTDTAKLLYRTSLDSTAWTDWSEIVPRFVDVDTMWVHYKAKNPNYVTKDTMSCRMRITRRLMTIQIDGTKVYDNKLYRVNYDSIGTVTGTDVTFTGKVVGDTLNHGLILSVRDTLGLYRGVYKYGELPEVDSVRIDSAFGIRTRHGNENGILNYDVSYIFNLEIVENPNLKVYCPGTTQNTAPITKVYDSTRIEPVATHNVVPMPDDKHITIEYSLDSIDWTTWGTTQPWMIQVDTQKVYVRAMLRGFYEDAVCQYNLSVTERPVTIKLDTTKVYDGQVIVSDYMVNNHPFTIGGMGLARQAALTQGQVTTISPNVNLYQESPATNLAQITQAFRTTDGDSNYRFTYDFDQEITKRNLYITLDTTKEYDRELFVTYFNSDSLHYSNNVTGEVLTAGKVTSSSYNIGTYTYAASTSTPTEFEITSGISNYTPIYTLKQTIYRSDNMTITCPDSAATHKVFDNTPINPTAVYGGLFAGDVAEIQYSRSEDNISWSGWSTTVPQITNRDTLWVKARAVSDNYDTVTCPYRLVVYPLRGVKVYITGHSAEYDYDGQMKTVTGYDIDSIRADNGLYHTADVLLPIPRANDSIVSGMGALGTPLSTYTMTMNSASFQNTNFNFEDVTFYVTPGVLRIYDSLTVLTLTTQPDSCWKDENGKATFIINGGKKGYEYSLDGGAYSTAVSPLTITGLGAGNHVVTIKDSLGYTDTAMFVITQPDSLTAVITIPSDLCPNQGSYQVHVTTGGGNSGHVLTWTGTTTTTIHNEYGTVTQRGVNDNDTIYKVSIHVVDAKGCTVDTSVSFQVKDVEAPVILNTLPDEDITGNEATDYTTVYTTVAQLEAKGLDISDNCTIDPELKVTYVDSVGDGRCPIRIYRTYTVTDSVGNSSTTKQNITVTDLTAPAIAGTLTNDTVYLTNACTYTLTAKLATVGVAMAHAGDLNITDANIADNTAMLWQRDEETDLGCEHYVIRLYTVKDSCGNESDTIRHKVVVIDNLPPVITGTLTNDTVYLGVAPACTYDITPFYMSTVKDIRDHKGGVTVEDCHIAGHTAITHAAPVENHVGVNHTWTVTYTVTDTCGNSTTIDQTIVVLDTARPVITGNMTNDTIQMTGAACDQFSMPADFTTVGGLVASSRINTLNIADCYVSDTTVLSNVEIEYHNGCERYFVRTYSFKDAAGNGPVSFNDTIVLVDKVKPELAGTLLADTVFLTNYSACDYTLPPAMATVGDVRTYATAHPHAGNFTITDCHVGDVTPLAFKSKTETNNGCDDRYVTRVYTVTDSCGNESDEFEHIIVIKDTNAPIISGAMTNDTIYLAPTCVYTTPGALTTVKGILEYPHVGTLTIHDCSLTETSTACVSYTDVETNNGPFDRYVTRTYSITDDCGNGPVTFAHKIVILDETTPKVDGTLTNDTVYLKYPGECVDYILTDTLKTIGEANTHGVTITDCNATDATALSVVEYGVSGPGVVRTVIRIYSVTDAAGNTTVLPSQTIYVIDSMAPTITGTLHADTTYLTGADCKDFGLATEFATVGEVRTYATTHVKTDNLVITDCNVSDATTVSSVQDTVKIGTTQKITRTYTVTDAGGHSSTFTHETYVLDTLKPQITGTMPNDTVYSKGTDVSCAFALTDTLKTVGEAITHSTNHSGTLTIEDCNVGTTTPITFSGTDTIVGPERHFIRTYTVTDSAGNSSTFSHTVVVVDTIDPVIVNGLGNDTVYFDDEHCIFTTREPMKTVGALLTSIWGVRGGLNILDCNISDTTKVTSVDHDTVRIANVATIQRTYYVKDNAGNGPVTITQTIVVRDTLAPVITGTMPNDTVYITDLGVCESYTLTDTLKTVSEAVTHAHLAGSTTFAITDCNVTGDTSLTMTDVETIDGNDHHYTRTYTVTDAFGNSSTFNHTVVVMDTVAPKITGTTVKDTVYMTDLGVCESYTLTDTFKTVGDVRTHVTTTHGTLTIEDCHVDNNTTITMTDVETVDGNTHYYTRTYYVTDTAGNGPSTFTHTVMVLDTVRPLITDTMPYDTVYLTDPKDCDSYTLTDTLHNVGEAHAHVGNLTIEDCHIDNNTPLTMTDVYNNLGTVQVYTRTYTVYDTAGNGPSTFKHKVIVLDTLKPELTGTWPSDISDIDSCFDNIPHGPTIAHITAQFTDCHNVTVDSTYQEYGNTCGWTAFYIYTIYDDAHNTIVDTVTYTGKDVTLPTYKRPKDTILFKDASCFADTTTASIGVLTVRWDNCTAVADLKVTYRDVNITPTCQGAYTFERIWRMVDNCGNVSISDSIQYVTVKDTTRPTFKVPVDTIICRDVADVMITDPLTSRTGVPTLQADNCTDYATLLTNTSYTIDPPTGTTSSADDSIRYVVRHWFVEDNCGNVTEKKQRIGVFPAIHTGNTTMICHDTAVMLAYGFCDTVLDLRLPDWSSTVKESPITLTNNAPAGYVFPVGTTIVTWTLTDTCGFTVTCDQKVVVSFPPCARPDDTVHYDGFVYHSVRVGCDCWLKENLRNVVYYDGTDVPVYSSYAHSAQNEEDFGLLYTWYSTVRVPEGDNTAVPATLIAPMGESYIQGICPDNWAVPTDEQFDNLWLNGYGITGIKDMDTRYWLPGLAGTLPNCGFNARGAGYYDNLTDRYNNLLGETYFWTGEVSSTYIPGHCAVISINCPDLVIQEQPKGRGQSVRCILKKLPTTWPY